MYLAKDTLLAMCNYLTLTHSGGIQINSPITAGRASHVFLSLLEEHHAVILLRPTNHEID